MNNWIDNVTYGNPIDKFLPLMKDGIYDALLPELKQYPFPSNSCEMTQDELRQLIELQNSEEQKNQTIISRYLDYDNDIINIFKKFCKNRLNQDYDEEIDGLIQDLAVLITKLKFAYQRPRPFQLAQYYKARLFPVISVAAISPAYPSGHTTEARVMAEFIGSRHPEQYNFLIQLSDDIAQSRLFLGLHYASDNDFALMVAKAVYTSKEFTTKYGL